MRLSGRTITNVTLLVLVNAMWAAQYAAYKTATESMGPITVSLWAFLIAALVLMPFLVAERRRRARSWVVNSPGQVTAKPPARQLWTRGNILGLFMVGVVGLIPASAFLAWGIDRSSASNAALLYLTVPIITALLASVILKEKMTPARWGSLFISLVGVLILSDFNWRHLGLTSSKYLFGNTLVLLACTSSSLYNTYSKQLLSCLGPLEILVYGYLIAVIIGIPLLIWVEPLSLTDITNYRPATWLALLVLSVLSWGVAMVLWMFLLQRLDVSQASVSIYLLPFLGVLIAAMTLQEKVTPTMIVGGLITLVGTVLITASEGASL